MEQHVTVTPVVFFSPLFLFVYVYYRVMCFFWLSLLPYQSPWLPIFAWHRTVGFGRRACAHLSATSVAAARAARIFPALD